MMFYNIRLSIIRVGFIDDFSFSDFALLLDFWKRRNNFTVYGGKQHSQKVCNKSSCFCSILLQTYNPGQNVWDTLCNENVIVVDPLHSWTVLGVTSQTPFIYFAHVKDLNFVQVGVGGKSCYGRVYECVSKFDTKTCEKGEVSKNLLARIVATVGRC